MTVQEKPCACSSGCVPAVKLPQEERLDALIDSWAGKPGALIPVLQGAQQIHGYLSDEVMRYIGERLRVSASTVFGVVTFYSFFSRVPRGKYLVRVCLGTACYVRGGQQVLAALKKELRIDVGETTADRLFSLDIGRCFGACGLAPVIMVNDTVHQRVKPARIRELLAPYRATGATTGEVA